MWRNIQNLSRPQRVLVFILLFGGGLLALIGISAVFVLGALNSNPRTVAQASLDTITVREFAALPDNEAYPYAVTVAADGTVYTGSYKTGAIYRIAADGQQVMEIPGTREAIGAAAGLTISADGTLYIVDHVDADLRTSGGNIKRLTPDGQVSDLATISDERGFVLPTDVALDAQGNVYVSDRGRDEVWRFNPDGSGGAVWWTSPQVTGNVSGYEPNGLAYDPVNDALIITDGAQSIIYRVALADNTTETLYQHPNRTEVPGFGGVTVTPDGTIYVAALALNRVVRLDDGVLTTLAQDFRGASDVAFAPPNKLYVTNFDQRSLAFTLESPRLPFALDVIEVGD